MPQIYHNFPSAQKLEGNSFGCRVSLRGAAKEASQPAAPKTMGQQRVAATPSNVRYIDAPTRANTTDSQDKKIAISLHVPALM